MQENSEYLAHHGVEGQKHGVRNGPPYPLSRKQYTPAMKKANPKPFKSTPGADTTGRKKKKKNLGYSNKLSDDAKKELGRLVKEKRVLAKRDRKAKKSERKEKRELKKELKAIKKKSKAAYNAEKKAMAAKARERARVIREGKQATRQAKKAAERSQKIADKVRAQEQEKETQKIAKQITSKRYKDARALSDEDLERAITRLRNEATYMELVNARTPKKETLGQKIGKTVKEEAVPAITKTAVEYGNKALRNYLGLDKPSELERLKSIDDVGKTQYSIMEYQKKMKDLKDTQARNKKEAKYKDAKSMDDAILAAYEARQKRLDKEEEIKKKKKGK